MKNLSRIIVGIMLLSMVIFSTPASARPSNAFYLRNSSSMTLHFTYGCSDSTRAFTRALAPHAAKYYWVKNGCTSYTIKKSTDASNGETKTFTYTIDAGHRYEIFWDKSKRAWNIQEL